MKSLLDIIEKKKNKQELSEEEINFFIKSCVDETAADYQVSSLLMAIRLNGMTPLETAYLTKAMVDSGETIDLSSVAGVKVDKHSTGGVGDKVSLLIAPILASLGVPVPKMSGRGLGITGGTLDKLESIKGFKTELSVDQFIKQVDEHKIAITSQSGNLVPADKYLYALRDVTGTVDSVPLIASSIMSKKIATGADLIILDIKCGKGAFMKTIEESRVLANEMIEIGKNLNKDVIGIITDMDKPLGYAIGNKLEVLEVYDILKDGFTKTSEGLRDVVIEICSSVLQATTTLTEEQAVDAVSKSIDSGDALAKFVEFVELQGGDVKDIKEPSVKHKIEIRSAQSGFIQKIDAEKIGRASLLLGAGRRFKGDQIDYDTGIRLERLVGERVEAGETLCVLYANIDDYQESEKLIHEGFDFSEEKPEQEKAVLDIIWERN